MRGRSILATACAGFLSVALLVGCGDADEQPSTPTSSPTGTPADEQPGADQPVNPDITPEQVAFVDELLATPLPLDDATARIEAAGYSWRLGTIDGEPQAVTMDYRIDRLTLTTQDGLVIDATWG